MLVGGGWLYLTNRRQPGTLLAIQTDLERTLEESAHAAALSEEQHHHHAPGHSFNPAPVGATMAATNMAAMGKSLNE